jgi:hypothetical protein
MYPRFSFLRFGVRTVGVLRGSGGFIDSVERGIEYLRVKSKSLDAMVALYPHWTPLDPGPVEWVHPLNLEGPHE